MEDYSWTIRRKNVISEATIAFPQGADMCSMYVVQKIVDRYDER